MIQTENPYFRIVAESARLIREARLLPIGGLRPPPRPTAEPSAPRVMIFAPGLGRECAVGGLPLRLFRQGGMRVINVAVNRGGSPESRSSRLAELRGACAYLGFELLTPSPAGLAPINPHSRSEVREHWDRRVKIAAELLATTGPRILLLPHACDATLDHVGVQMLVLEGLARVTRPLDCVIVETECCAPMKAPNLMVESDIDDVADLVAASSFHASEASHRLWHLRLPSWLQTNGRRGAEIIGSHFDTGSIFATLYRVRRWRGGKLNPAYQGRRLLRSTESAGAFAAELGLT